MLTIFSSNTFCAVLYTYACGSGGLVVKSCQALATPWTITHQAPLCMGFPRQEYWGGWPFPSLGYLLDPESKSWSSCIAGGLSP